MSLDQTTVSHGACGKTWHQSGNATSHCGGCHETFVSLSVFDSHRRDSLCIAPTETLHRKSGLAQRADGIWFSPAAVEAARIAFTKTGSAAKTGADGESAPGADISAQDGFAQRSQERPGTVPGSPAPSEGAIGALIRSITTPTAYWSEWPDSTFDTPTETGETA